MAVFDGIVRFDSANSNFNGNLFINGAKIHFRTSTTLVNPLIFSNNTGETDVPNFLNVFADHTVDLDGPISGEQWAKRGNGTLILDGQSSAGAGVGVEAGTLRLGANDRFGNFNATLDISSGATFDLAGHGQTLRSITGSGFVDLGNGSLSLGFGDESATFDATVSGGGEFRKIGGGTLTIANDQNYAGPTVVAGGTLAISGVSQSSFFNLQGGELRLNAADRLPNGANMEIQNGTTFNLNGHSDGINELRGTGNITLGNGGGIGVGLGGGSSTFSGTISGAGILQKDGGGLITLGQNNGYTGQTVITGGVLALSGTSQSDFIDLRGGELRLNLTDRLLSDPDVNIHAGATFNVNGRSDSIGKLTGSGTIALGNGGNIDVGEGGGTSEFSGVITGSGGRLTKVGNGTLTLSGNNSYNGATTISNGTLRLGQSNSISNNSGVIVNAGATFDLNGYTDAVGSLSGSGIIVLVDGALLVGDSNIDSTFSGNIVGDIAGNFSKRGAGTVTLTGDTDFQGQTTVSLGTLALTGTANSRTYAMTNGELRLNAANRLHDTARVSIGSNGRFSLAGHDETIGSLEGDGVIDLGGGNLLIAGNDRNSSFSGTIQGNGSLTKAAPETMTLSGDSTYTGLTTVVAGRLIVNGQLTGGGGASVLTGATLGGSGSIAGNLTAAGRVAPGNSPGILTVSGDFTQTAESILEIEIAGSESPGGGVAGVDFDQLQVGGTASLGGTIEIVPFGGYTPTLGDSITAVTASLIDTSATPKISAPGLAEFNDGSGGPDLAIRVSATPAAPATPTDVVIEYVEKSVVEFTDGSNDTANWFLGSGWDTGNVPTSSDETLVTGNLFTAQTVEVEATANVHALRVSDTDGGITVDVGSSGTLNASTGDVVVEGGGAIELDGGVLSALSTREVKLEGGMLKGTGQVDLMESDGSSRGTLRNGSGTVSPGISGGVGTLQVMGDYIQESAGTLSVDGAATSVDLVDVKGDATLTGTIEVDASSLTVSGGDVLTVLTADSVSLALDELTVTGLPSGLYLTAFVGSAPGAGAGASSSGGQSVNFQARFKGDAIILPGQVAESAIVDDADLAVFAAIVLDPGAGKVTFDDVSTSITDWASVFDFTGVNGLPDQQVDVLDLPHLAELYQQSNGGSMAQAYAAIGVALRNAESYSIPEPSTLLIASLTILTLANRRSRHVT